MGDVAGAGDEVVSKGSGTQTIYGNLHGTGSFIRSNGTTVLGGGASDYSGDTILENGATLVAARSNALSANSYYEVDETSKLDTQGFSQTIKGMKNAGTVNVSTNVEGSVGSVLKVDGDYVGDNGTMILGLNGIMQSADVLEITGDASGKTLVQINVLGKGARTIGDGVELIKIGGNFTGEEFSLVGNKAIAGSYEYKLFASDLLGLGNVWYLRSFYRGEIPLFTATSGILKNIDRESIGTLHTRMGDVAKTGNGFSNFYDSGKRIWARLIAKNSDIEQSGTAPVKTDMTTYGLQSGIDFYANKTWNSGLYATALTSDAKVYSLSDEGYEKAGDIDVTSYYLGLYATYMPSYKNSYYLDLVGQVGFHKMNLKPKEEGSASKRNDATSYSLSAETGYPFYFGQRKAFGIEPQVQVIYTYTDVKKSSMNGTDVDVKSSDEVIGRLGLRLFTTYEILNGHLSPYVKGNVWRRFNGSSVVGFNDGTAFESRSKTGGTTYELGLGTTYNAFDNMNIYAEYTREFSSGSESMKVNHIDSYSLGLKYNF
ncbi:MAG: autotransporter outer membrane beta-barrel domain-containing protein [Alphaproteobacteria bacterium]|nr:autotransporter outer membrane beta-barrel domain-containing protein [Alphaproteobacteria bacterium]